MFSFIRFAVVMVSLHSNKTLNKTPAKASHKPLCFSFLRQSVAKVDLEHLILQPQPPTHLDYKPVLPHPAGTHVVFKKDLFYLCIFSA